MAVKYSRSAYKINSLVLAIVNFIEKLGGVLEAVLRGELVLIDGVLHLVVIVLPSFDGGKVGGVLGTKFGLFGSPGVLKVREIAIVVNTVDVTLDNLDSLLKSSDLGGDSGDLSLDVGVLSLDELAGAAVVAFPSRVVGLGHLGLGVGEELLNHGLDLLETGLPDKLDVVLGLNSDVDSALLAGFAHGGEIGLNLVGIVLDEGLLEAGHEVRVNTILGHSDELVNVEAVEGILLPVEFNHIRLVADVLGDKLLNVSVINISGVVPVLVTIGVVIETFLSSIFFDVLGAISILGCLERVGTTHNLAGAGGAGGGGGLRGGGGHGVTHDGARAGGSGAFNGLANDSGLGGGGNGVAGVGLRGGSFDVSSGGVGGEGVTHISKILNLSSLSVGEKSSSNGGGSHISRE